MVFGRQVVFGLIELFLLFKNNLGSSSYNLQSMKLEFLFLLRNESAHWLRIAIKTKGLKLRRESIKTKGLKFHRGNTKCFKLGSRNFFMAVHR